MVYMPRRERNGREENLIHSHRGAAPIRHRAADASTLLPRESSRIEDHRFFSLIGRLSADIFSR